MHIAIVGGGIAGLATAVHLQQKINSAKVTVYERDNNFDDRKPGYGLTLTYSESGALAALNILERCARFDTPSRSHFIFWKDGSIRGYYGNAFLDQVSLLRTNGQRGNLRVARQKLRGELLGMLCDKNAVQWGKRLAGITSTSNNKMNLAFEDGTSSGEVDLVVGADGVNSKVRGLVLPTRNCLLRLGVFVILGVTEHADCLLDGRGFYTVSDRTRFFTMPFESDEMGEDNTQTKATKYSTMWQLSFVLSPGDEDITIDMLKQMSPKDLQTEALRRTKNWHEPVGKMIITSENVWGTELCDVENPIELHKRNDGGDDKKFDIKDGIILVGDAQHAMSPFKGQGANQSLIDATELVSFLARGGKLKPTLRSFEREMNQRTRPKVLESRKGIFTLHDINEVAEFGFSCAVQDKGKRELLALLRREGISSTTEDLDARCRSVIEKHGYLKLCEDDPGAADEDTNIWDESDFSGEFLAAVATGDMSKVRRMSNNKPRVCRMVSADALAVADCLYVVKWLIMELKVQIDPGLLKSTIEKQKEMGGREQIVDFLTNVVCSI